MTNLSINSKVNGVSVIMDFSGLSLSQIVHFTPPFAAMVLDWVQNCISARLKAIYIINNSYVFNVLVGFCELFHKVIKQQVSITSFQQVLNNSIVTITVCHFQAVHRCEAQKTSKIYLTCVNELLTISSLCFADSLHE